MNRWKEVVEIRMIRITKILQLFEMWYGWDARAGKKGVHPPARFAFRTNYHKLRSFAQTVQFRNPPGCCLKKLDGKSGGENEGKRIMFKERNFLKFDTYTINN